MPDNKYAAGIVLYNPNINRLIENINHIVSQVDEIVLVDNFSANIKEIDIISDKYSNVTLIKNSRNMGIAQALNEIVKFTKRKGYKWVVTLDQDSVVCLNIITEYNTILNSYNNVGLLTCNIVDRNYSLNSENKSKNDEQVDFCITSGSLVNISVWDKISGFNEILFIDCVDLDYCIRLRNAGYSIIKSSKTSILHELGNSRVIKLFNKELLVNNHSAFRDYYIIRNQIVITRRYYSGLKEIKRFTNVVLLRIFIILCYEDNHYGKLKMIIKGFIDGMKME